MFTRQNYHRNTPEDGVLWTVDVETGEAHQLTTKWPEQCPTPVDKTTWTDIRKR